MSFSSAERCEDDSKLGRVAWGLAISISAAAALRLFFEYRGCGLVGWDTYPLIEVSRISSLDDFFRLFSESLMGKAEGGLYYRPVAKLSIALDYAVFGLSAPGYQSTSAMIAGAAGLSLFWATRELTCTSPRSLPVGALVALCFFFVQPLLATVVPAPARRPDLLCLLFMGLATAVQARASRRPGASLLPALFAFLAMSTKEPGFLLLGLCPLIAGCSASTRSRARIRAALVAALPIVAATMLALGIRVAVLGDIVGERPFRGGGELLASLPQMASWILACMFAPGAAFGDLEIPWLLWLPVPTLLILAFSWLSGPRRSALAKSLVPVLLLSAAWILAAICIYAVGIVFQPWYALNPIFALCLSVGAVSQALWELAGEGGRVRALCAAGLACLALLSLDYLRNSPLLGASDDWTEATEVSDRYLTELAARIESAEPGAVLEVARPPALLPPRSQRLRGVVLFAPYTVEAWARLRFGDSSLLRFRAARRPSGRDSSGRPQGT